MKEVVKGWVKKAEEDYKAAKILLSASEFPPSVVGFHAQQCAEKYLKAFLASHRRKFPRIHDLVKLNSSCVEIDSDFENIDDSLHALNPFSVNFRYPGVEVNAGEAREAMEHAKRVRDVIRRKLGLGCLTR